MSTNLRPYQNIALNLIRQAWDKNAQNVLMQLATGGGKTVIVAKVLQDFEHPSLTIAHRSEIVSQISLALARNGVRHSLIAQKTTIRSIIALHMSEIGRSYYDPKSKCCVASVDTLIKRDNSDLKNIQLLIQDEAHHVLRKNKWGKVAQMFPNARGLYVTATPIRADGHGLGRHADGIIDQLIVGPSMRTLIEDGYLTDYRIFAPPSDLDLSEVTISATGDYSPPKLRTAVHKSHITGDVVQHYLRIAKDKLGVTFAVDISAATEIAEEFRKAGVSAEIISSKTPDLLRASIMRRFRNREILQIVNVDILGEGVDVPAMEVVSMARPTQSYALYAQQFGRALRPLNGKTHAIIIDHVGNVLRHGLPDAPRTWLLDRREKRKSTASGIIPLRTCLNLDCLAVYQAVHKKCPYCGYYSPPTQRCAPEFVDGDLLELDISALMKLRGEVDKVDSAPKIPQNLDSIAQRAIINRHHARQQYQKELREQISLWAGQQKALGRQDSEIYRLFYFQFGIDILSAQSLGAKDSQLLKEKINA